MDIEFHGLNLGWFNLNIIMITATVFGGLGIILTRNNVYFPLTIIIPLISGIIISKSILKFIIRPLKKSQNTSIVSQKNLIGLRAKSGLTIKNEEVGYIIYTINGNTYQAPSKSYNKEEVKVGEIVLIMDIKENIFFVEKVEGFDFLKI